MGEMEAARATFEAKARRVSDELAKLQEQVEDSNALIARERRAIIGEEAKRRRRSGDRTPATRSMPNPDEQAEAGFDDAVNDVDERLLVERALREDERRPPERELARVVGVALHREAVL